MEDFVTDAFWFYLIACGFAVLGLWSSLVGFATGRRWLHGDAAQCAAVSIIFLIIGGLTRG